MAWAKFDDRWATHPKLLAAGLEAKGLDASGICYAAGQETDGFVPDTALVILGAGHRHPHKVAARLVEVGRWVRDDERKGYLIHDFDVYNFTRAQGEAKRKRDAERKAEARAKQGRDAKGRITSGQTSEEVRADTHRCPLGFAEESERTPTLVPPVPTRPDPTPLLDRSSSSLDGGAGEVAEEEELRDRVTTAARLVAERRLAARTGDPLTNATAWLRKVRAEVLTDHGGELHEMAAQGRHPKAMADRIMPPVANPYPAAGEDRRAWADDDVTTDEHGRLVVVRSAG